MSCMKEEDYFERYVISGDKLAGTFWISAIDPADGEYARVSEEVWKDRGEAVHAYDHRTWTPA